MDVYTRRAVSTAVICCFLWSNLIYALPEGGTVVSGNATISQNSTTTQITQTSPKAIIQWQHFDTATNEQVRFIQPSVSAIALNRITSGLPTHFAGLLSANGQVWIINPAGILFTHTSRVDVGGLVATTLDINNQDFINGNYQFKTVPGFANTAIVNNGNITASSEGIVALVAPGVENNGVIQAELGKVALASGTAYTLDLYGDQLIHFATDSKVTQAVVAPDGRILKNGVANTGLIQTNGGKVLLTANTAANIVDNVVSMNGVIEAKTITQGKNGVIVLGGDEGIINISGKIDVSADKNGDAGKIIIKGDKTSVTGTLLAKGGSESGNGGFVETSGNYVDLNRIHLDLTAPNGKAGTWYIDPYDIYIVPGFSSATTNNTGNTAFTPIGDDSTIGVETINVQLAQGATVNIDTAGAGTQSGNITITGMIDDQGTGGALILRADNNININTAMELSTSTLNATAAGSININAEINAISAQFTAGNTISIGANVTTSNTQIYNGDVNIASSATLSGTAISFNNALDGNNSLIINGDTAFNGAVGNAMPLATLTVAGTTTFNTLDTIFANTQVYAGQVILNQDTSLNGDANFQVVTSTNNRSLDITGDATFNDQVGDLNVLRVSGTTTFNTPSPVVAQDQNYLGLVVLLQNTALNGDSIGFNSINGNGNDLTIGATTSTTFDGNIDDINNLTVTSMGIGLSGEIGNFMPLHSLVLNGNIFIDTNIIHTVDTQSYNGPVILEGLTPKNMSGTSLIFNDTLNGDRALVISGNADFYGAIGNTMPLTSLLVSGNTTFNNTANIVSAGEQTYSGPVTLNLNTTFIGDSIDFQNAIAGNTNNLTVTATDLATFNDIDDVASLLLTNTSANIAFFGRIGNTTSVNNIQHDGSGTIFINTDVINTANDQTYNGIIVLNDPSITMTGVNITFNNDVSGDSQLSINGTTNIQSSMGGNSPLATLSINGASNINGSLIHTSGAQTYNGIVNFSSTGALTTLTGNSITFNNTANTSTTNVIINSTSGFTITNPITFTNNKSLTINASAGGVAFNAPINISGVLTVNANGPITQTAPIAADPTFSAGNNPITLTNPSNAFVGDVNLSNTGNNDIDIVNSILLQLGTVSAGRNFTATAPSVVLNNNETAGNAIQYNAPVVLGVDAILTAVSINFTDTLDATTAELQGLTNNANAIFNGFIGNNAALKFLTVTGTTLLNTSQISTNGNQTYNGLVTLTQNLSDTAGSGNMVFTNGVSGSPYDFTVMSADNFNTPNGIYINASNISIASNFINANFAGDNIFLNGANGMVGDVNAGSLTLDGMNGGNLTGIVNGIDGPAAAMETQLAPGALGNFYVNNCLVGTNCMTPEPTPINVLPPNIPDILEGFDENDCMNENCLVSQWKDSNLEEIAGTVLCVMGFAIAVDSKGEQRILLPGEKVYMNEKIVTDNESQVTLRTITDQTLKITADQTYQLSANKMTV